MALADLATRPAGRGSHECGICYAARALTESDAQALATALSNSAVMFSEIANELTALGYPVSHLTVSRHARGLCGAGVRFR